jgi:hypothetical protein
MMIFAWKLLVPFFCSLCDGTFLADNRSPGTLCWCSCCMFPSRTSLHCTAGQNNHLHTQERVKIRETARVYRSADPSQLL